MCAEFYLMHVRHIITSCYHSLTLRSRINSHHPRHRLIDNGTSPASRSTGCTGHGLRLRLLVWDEFYRHTPQHTAPWDVRVCIPLFTLTVTLAISLALTAHEADGLTIPIMHQVERDAARQLQ